MASHRSHTEPRQSSAWIQSPARRASFSAFVGTGRL